MRKTLLILCCTAALAISACTGESGRPVATGTASFRAINAIPTSPTFTVVIEERVLANVDYKDTSALSNFDDLDYTFSFEVVLAGDLTRTRVARVPIETVRDTEYTFLLSGAIATPTVTVWEADQRVWAATDTVFQTRFAHASESLGPVDVYFQAPGTPPVIGMEAGTLAFTELLPATDYPEGDYVVIFTTAGDPADVLFTSDTLTPLVQAGFTVALFDADANDVGPHSVRVITDAGSTSGLADVNTTPTVRFFHATPNLATSDIYTDEMLTDQIVADHMFQDVTADIPIAADFYTFTYTAVGNTGTILHEDSFSIFAGNRVQIYVIGAVDELVSFLRVPDRRSVETFAKFSFLYTATNHDLVDLYIVESGTDIAEAIPRFFNLTVGSAPITANFQANDLELYLTPAGEKTVIAGPVAFTAALGDVIDYIAYDNVDPAIADLVAIPLP